MVNASTTELLRRAVEEVRADRRGELSFRTRRHLLASLGPTTVGEGPLSPGHHQRAVLAVRVVEKVLPIWESTHEVTHPQDLLAATVEVIEGGGDRGGLRDRAYAFGGALLDGAPKNQRPALYVAHAATCAAYVAALDEIIEPDEGVTEAQLDDPQDPDLWDCAVWAAAAYAGEFPWSRSEEFRAERNREFWRWYLDEAFPAAAV